MIAGTEDRGEEQGRPARALVFAPRAVKELGKLAHTLAEAARRRLGA